MENKRFFTATDVQEMLGVSLSYAYKLIRKLNAEQEAKGLVTIKGRISSKYLMKRIYGLMPEYSKKKIAKACEILKMICENPNISIDELRVALDVTDRTIARYISELKDKGIIERKGPDNGGEWRIK